MKRFIIRLVRICVIGVLLFGLTFVTKRPAFANGDEYNGFIIQADLIKGNAMVSKLVINKNGEPIIRFEYKEAKIYGMKLVKELKTDGGVISTVIKASGPIVAKNMVVDVTAMDFQSPCLSLGTLYPEMGLKGVTLVSEYMSSGYMDMKALSLTTISGKVNVKRPSMSSLLVDLTKKGKDAMKQEAQHAMESNRPLTCEKEDEESSEDGAIGTIASPLDPILNGEDPVFPGEVLDPIKEIPGKVLNPDIKLPEVVDPVLELPEKVVEIPSKIVEPIIEDVDEVVDPIVDDTIEEVVEPVVNPLVNVALTTIDETESILEDVAASISQTKSSTIKEEISAQLDKLRAYKNDITSTKDVSQEDINRLNEVKVKATELQTKTNSILEKSLFPLHLLTTTLLSGILEPLDSLKEKISSL